MYTYRWVSSANISHRFGLRSSLSNVLKMITVLHMVIQKQKFYLLSVIIMSIIQMYMMFTCGNYEPYM